MQHCRRDASDGVLPQDRLSAVRVVARANVRILVQSISAAYKDIAFCLPRAAGYRNVWTPFAELYHHESATRGRDDTPQKQARFAGEVQTMMERWGHLLRQDPAYNPNLTLSYEDFSLAWPPRPAPGGLPSQKG